LAQLGPKLLSRRCDLIVTSVGALSNPDLEAQLRIAADKGGRLIFCAGAIGGLDLLQAAKLSGLQSVTYVSRKPPTAWRGTKAEETIVLDGLQEATCFYEGTARGAARDFPQNANVAATLALFGAGFDATRVQLVADPQAAGNVHEVMIASACVNVRLRIEGKASPDNPKTSLTTAYSLAAEVLRWIDAQKR
jgi:aspartate dehydrogenase